MIGEEERRLVLRIGSAVSQGLEPRGFALGFVLRDSRNQLFDHGRLNLHCRRADPGHLPRRRLGF